MKRTFAIGDIHGCVCTFRQLLFGVIRLVKSDTVYLLGDYIDRGPDSKGVIEAIIELQQQGYNLKPILGNHEDLLITALDSGDPDCYVNWLVNGGRATLKSYGVDHGEDLPQEHLDFMRELPALRMTRGHVLVHAGLNFRLDDPLTGTSRSDMLWERRVTVESAKIGGRKLVTGHSILDLDEIRESLTRDHIRLDNGCWYSRNYPGCGNLLALELNSGELFVQHHMG